MNHHTTPSCFPTTRQAALAAWHTFQPQLTAYRTLRNFVKPGHPDVSRLSPAIRHGLLHPAEIVADSLRNSPVTPIEKWIQEVEWRRYWKGWLEVRPSVWRSWRDSLRWLKSSGNSKMIARAETVANGQGGVAIMDYFARELAATGYLHNHARMWWASYWIHVERLPWELGAEVFFQRLLDADPAANTLSWRWVAGLQTVGKTYLVRAGNLRQYVAPEILQNHSKGMDLLEDDRLTAWTPPHPVLPPVKLTPPALPTLVQTADLPSRWGLWIHLDDASPETSQLRGLNPTAARAFTSKNSYATYGLGPQRQKYMTSVLTDAVQRVSQAFDITATLTDADELAAGLLQFCREERLDGIICLAPSVGPVGDAWALAKELLHQNNIRTWNLYRPEDAAVYPLATAGFFPFWEKRRKQLG